MTWRGKLPSDCPAIFKHELRSAVRSGGTFPGQLQAAADAVSCGGPQLHPMMPLFGGRSVQEAALMQEIQKLVTECDVSNLLSR